MDRRHFLRAAIVASGAVAVDQLELLDRLGWVRRLFTTGGYSPTWEPGEITLHKSWSVVEISGPTMHRIQSDPTAFVRWAESQLGWERRVLTFDEVGERYGFKVDRG